MHVIAIPEVINAAGLLPFLEQLGSVPEVEAEIVIEFSGLRRVSPAGLVALVAAVKHWQGDRKRRVRFAGLEQCSIRGYLQRMDVLRACGVELPEDFNRLDARGRFVPVQRIEDVDAMSREVAGCLAPGGDDFEHPLAPIYDLAAYVIGELGANVRQHSGGMGFVSAQVSGAEGMIRIAVADNGRGVRQSFVDAGLPWSQGISDVGALRKALEPRVSSKGEPVNQGVGLTLVSGLARLTEAWLLIASETGTLQLNPGGVLLERPLAVGSHYRGTLLAMTFRRDRLQDFYQLLDAAKQEAGLLVKRPIKTTFT